MKARTIFMCTSAQLLICTLAAAQSASPDIIASAGDHFSSVDGSVSWTIGEPVGDTYSSSSNILTKGFHQPATISLSSIAENNPENGFYAYPNPVDDQLMLDFSKMKSGDYEMIMYDVTGQVVRKQDIEWQQGGKPKTIPMEEIRAGVYFIRIKGSESCDIVLRIIRQ